MILWRRWEPGHQLTGYWPQSRNILSAASEELRWWFSLMWCQVIINSLWHSDAIWHHRYGSTLVQVMDCCLTAPSHYLNQWWCIIAGVWWHSPEGNIVRNAIEIYLWYEFENYKFKIPATSSPRVQWVLIYIWQDLKEHSWWPLWEIVVFWEFKKIYCVLPMTLCVKRLFVLYKTVKMRPNTATMTSQRLSPATPEPELHKNLP